MQLHENLFDEIEYITPNAEFNLLFDDTNQGVVEDVIKASYPKNQFKKTHFNYQQFIQIELKTAIVGIINVHATLFDAIKLYNRFETKQPIQLLKMPQFQVPEYRYFLTHRPFNQHLDIDLCNGNGHGNGIAHFFKIVNQH